MSDKFQLLLKQIRFPEDHDAFKEIKDGSIETVKLFKSKRQWFFVFSFPILGQWCCENKISILSS